MFTVEEIDAAIELAEQYDDEDRSEFEDYGTAWLTFYYEDGPWTIPNIGEVVKVEAGGGEGDGAETYVVVRIGGRLYRKTGYYSSWDSDSMDGATVEVEPYIEPVTFYRPVTRQ